MIIRIVAVLLALSTGWIGLAHVGAGNGQTPPAPLVTSSERAAQAAPTESTPPRLSYLFGEVSFWRPGAEGWAPARLNMPLAPGDAVYTGPGGTVEVQVGPRAFVRAAAGTQLGLDNQEPDYLQLRVTAGYAALDLRGLPAGQSVEIDTPNAAFTIERPGYYRVDVDADSTAFATYRGGTATMTLPNGNPSRIPAARQVVITGGDSPRLATGATPALTAWDRWGYQRSDYLLQPVDRTYVAPAVYGVEALEQYGSWRVVETYGPVWTPANMPPGWSPYSTGRWIWDPRFGWTWLDDAPWGWAPYHYGRWVYLGGVWAWAPGPIVVHPVYAPALVVFLGGPTVGVAAPVYWAPLAWGEPVIPWWGRPGFVGVPWWGGWGGPRVVNNVVIAPTTTVKVTNITVYKNVGVTNAVVGLPANTFGHGLAQPTRVGQTQAQQLAPVSGPTTVTPVPASLVPATGPTPAPPASVQARSVVATRPPRQGMPTPQQQGVPQPPAASSSPAPKIVPAPAPVATSRRGVSPAQPAGPGSSRTTPAPNAPSPSSPSVPTAPRPPAAPPSTTGVPSTRPPAVASPTGVPPAAPQPTTPVPSARPPQPSAPKPSAEPSKQRERSDMTATSPTHGKRAMPPPPPPAERPARAPSPTRQAAPPRERPEQK